MPRPWNKGLTKATSAKVQAYSNKLCGREVSVETRAKIAAARSKGRIFYTTCQLCGRTKGYSPRHRCNFCAAKWRVEHFPNAMKGRKLSPEHKQRLLTANQHQRGQTKPEKRVHDLLNYIFGRANPYHYSGFGDEQFWITINKDRVRNPDFVAPELRKVIEVFGHYWHKLEDEQKAIKDYASVGWKCRVIWEKSHPLLRDDLLYFTYPEEEINELWDFMREPL